MRKKIITKKKSQPVFLESRRKFLHGAGGMLFALPFLKSLYPGEVLAASTNTDRYIAMYMGNGVVNKGQANSVYNYWRCTGNSTSWNLSRSLAGLASIKNHISVFHDLNNDGQDRLVSAGGDGGRHWGASSSFLTGQAYDWNNRANRIALMMSGSSLDVAIGRSKGTAIPFVNLALEQEWDAGTDDRGSGKILGSISYSDQNTRLRNTITSRETFNKLFGNYNPTSTPSPVILSDIFKRKRSILDFVNKQATALKPKLAAEDRSQMDYYLESVRGIELAIQAEERRNAELLAGTCQVPSNSAYQENNPGDTAQLNIRCNNMMDLIVLAFQCDLTRVATIMLSLEHSYYDTAAYVPGSISYAYHEASHYTTTDQDNRIKAATAVVSWEVNQFQKMIVKLQNAKDFDGTSLLNRTLVHLGAGLGDGDYHLTTDLACVLGGHAGGLAQGKLKLMNGAQYSNFLLSIGRMMGYTGSLGLATATLDLT